MSQKSKKQEEHRTMWQAESMDEPCWLAIRFEGKGGKLWAWMIHPDQAKPFRDALGPLAIGRADWESMYVGAIVNGIIGQRLHEAEISGRLESELELLQDQKFNASALVRGEFNPYRARSPLPVAWATISASASRASLLRLLAWVDAALHRQFPGLLPVFGPYSASVEARPIAMPPGSDLVDLIPKAQALWEARAMEAVAARAGKPSASPPRI